MNFIILKIKYRYGKRAMVMLNEIQRLEIITFSSPSVTTTRCSTNRIWKNQRRIDFRRPLNSLLQTS